MTLIIVFILLSVIKLKFSSGTAVQSPSAFADYKSSEFHHTFSKKNSHLHLQSSHKPSHHEIKNVSLVSNKQSNLKDGVPLCPMNDTAYESNFYEKFKINDYISNSNLRNSQNVKVLLVGDSLNRNFVNAICDSIGQTVEDYFPRKKSSCKYQSPHHDSVSCRDKKDRFVFANLFFHGVTINHENEDSLLENMKRKHLSCEPGLPQGLPSIEVSIRNFVEKYGGLDLIIMKSFYWDLFFLCREGMELRQNNVTCGSVLSYAAQFPKFLDCGVNVIQNRKLFKNNLPLVALMTDPVWNVDGVRLCSTNGDPREVVKLGMEMLEVVSQQAQTRKLLFFDFFSQFRGIAPCHYLSDDIHITKEFSLLEANFILERMYSQKNESRFIRP